MYCSQAIQHEDAGRIGQILTEACSAEIMMEPGSGPNTNAGLLFPHVLSPLSSSIHAPFSWYWAVSLSYGPLARQQAVLHDLACDSLHSDSLDTLLYVRFAIQNLEFYEWKWGDRGWALSWHRTHTLLALWPDVTSSFTYEKTEREQVFSFVSYSRFKNLQFHGEICNSIVCILMRGVQWALWFVTSSWSECLSYQRFADKLTAWWAAKRRLVSNDRHGVISFLILANKPFSFS